MNNKEDMQPTMSNSKYKNFVSSKNDTGQNIQPLMKTPTSELVLGLSKAPNMKLGQRMLNKMGWSGGGLGKSGEGIVEPIAPNTTYASRKLGFGLNSSTSTEDKVQTTDMVSITPSAKNTQMARTKRNQKKKHICPPQRQYYKPEVRSLKPFKTYALQTLLDFVRNDSQVEFFFDTRLTNAHRKCVHTLVQDIENDDYIGDVDNPEQMDLIQNILEFKAYELYTQSFGQKPDRQIGIFKDAPAHVFLVVPEDLRKNNDKLYNDTELEKDVGKVLENSKYVATEIRDITAKTNEDDVNSINNSNVVLSSANENVEQRSHTKNDMKSTPIENEQISENNTCKIKKTNVISHVADSNFKPPKVNAKVRDDENVNELRKKPNYVNNTLELEKFYINEFFANSEESTTTVGQVLEKVVDFFTEFANDDSYTEFRFLGLFNNTEYNALVDFFNLCINNEGVWDGVVDKLRAALDNDAFYFNLQDNCNGSTVIYKEKKQD
ncbi:unnamed protein product [Leptosia nina]|uniref:G-patch domain-containing protein n=1 Tax=Leptosia nina TaxID=320188 RepID=A0AAV1JIQ2_9NEOP